MNCKAPSDTLDQGELGLATDKIQVNGNQLIVEASSFGLK